MAGRFAIALAASSQTARSTEVVPVLLVGRVEQELWPLFASGHIRPVIDTAFPLEKAADAHLLMESGKHTGKIILEMS